MSQVAAFNCGEALVFSADSQETRGSLKVKVPKLIVRPETDYVVRKGDEIVEAPAITPGMKIVFAGAGDGPFIDKLIDEIWEAVLQVKTRSLESWSSTAQETCLRVHEKFWKVYPKGMQPIAELLIGISSPAGVRLYKAVGPIVNQVEKYEVSGSSAELVPYLADSLYHPWMDVDEAVIMATHILRLADDYADGVGGPHHILVLKPGGEHETIDPHRMLGAIRQLNQLAVALNRVLLSVPNPGLSEDRFKGEIKELTRVLRELREQQKAWGKTFTEYVENVLYSSRRKARKAFGL